MSRKLIRFMLLMILIFGLLLTRFITVDAQRLEIPLARATPTEDVVNIDANEVPFRIFEKQDISLSGPYDSAYYTFSLPSSWALSQGAELHLDMTVSFTNISSSDFGYPVTAGGGKLTLYMNDTLLGVLNLDQNGNTQATVSIPPEAFLSNRSDGRLSFYALLDAYTFCYVDDNYSLLIHPTSYFSLPHSIVAPVPDLVNVSKLIYEDSFIHESALIVIPDRPSAGELQAALTVGGWLGNISRNNLLIDVTTISAMTPEQQASNHLILVGKPTAFTSLENLNLPDPPIDGNFKILEGKTDAGIIQMVNSPWNISNLIVFVSGNSDSGVIKAAQALSTGVIRQNRFSNLAIVEDIQPLEAVHTSISAPETRTLESMGYSNSLFVSSGFAGTSYDFQIPLGWTVSDNAYFELAYGNSSLINFNQSGIIVRLNRNPIGSVRFDAKTAENPINKVKINIPQSAIVPGNNLLEVQAYIYPNDVCSPPDYKGNWVNIWKDSVLSTPLVQQQVDVTTAMTLADYPAPFIFDSELNSTAFVLPENDLNAWRSAIKISSYLASQANSPIVTLSTFYGKDFPENLRQNYHVILIGKPSQLPIVSELGNLLPVPFESGSDKAIEGNMRVIFNIPEDVPLGYVELLGSPWNSDKNIIAILGNSTQGEIWAGSAMTDDTLRSKISGNLSIVNGFQILASDTRIFPIAGIPLPGEATPNVSIKSTPEPNPQNASVPQDQKWILFAIVIGVILIILLIVAVVIMPFLKKRLPK